MARVKYKDTAVDDSGNAISGATVEVRDGAGALATLYAAGTGSTQAYGGLNPFTAGDGDPDRVGSVEFWVEEGSYSVATGAGASQVAYPFEAISAATVAAAAGAAGPYAGQGGWDASSGSFPSGSTAMDLWEVETAGTVDSVSFAVGDQLIALVDSASTGTYAANWFKKAGGTVTQDDLDLKADAADAALTGTTTAENLAVSGDLTVGGDSVLTDGASAFDDTLTRSVLTAESNVFDIADITDNACINATTGAEFSVSGYYATGFIEVVSGRNITLSHNSLGTGSLGYVWYDEDQAYISGSTTAITAETPLAVPVGAIYVRISFQKSTVAAADLMISLGDAVPATYTEHLGYTPTKALDGAMNATFYARGIEVDLLDRTQFESGYYCNANGVLIANASYTATGLFPVPRGGTITLAGETSGASNKIQYFDVSGRFVSADSGEWTSGDTRDIPTNAVFARIGIETAEIDGVQIFAGSITPGNFAETSIPRLSDLYTWAGTSWLLIGDSISAYSDFGQSIVSALHGSTSLDATLASRKIDKALYRDDDTTALVSGDFTDVDAVHFWLGTNDWSAGTAIGAITDTPDYASGTTFYALFMGAIEQILAWAPTITIFIGTAMWRDGAEAVRGGGSGGDLAAYNDAIRAIANKYALPIIDYRNDSGLNDYTVVDTTTYSGDGVHPNGPGRNRIRGLAVGRINSVLPTA